MWRFQRLRMHKRGFIVCVRSRISPAVSRLRDRLMKILSCWIGSVIDTTCVLRQERHQGRRTRSGFGLQIPFDPDSVLNLRRKVEQFCSLFPRSVSAAGCARSRCNIPPGTCASTSGAPARCGAHPFVLAAASAASGHTLQKDRRSIGIDPNTIRMGFLRKTGARRQLAEPSLA